MKNKQLSIILTYVIAFVWMANGLFCKVLNLVPRHQEIVARILGDDDARSLTFLIGISEVIMAIWILSGYKSKWNAWTQIFIVALMNTLEFILVPDILLWGKFNAVFAFMFILVVYFNEFKLRNTFVDAH